VAVVVNEVTGNRLPGRHLSSRLPGDGWGEMQRLVLAQAPELSAPMPGMPGLCAACRGPTARGRARCFQCDLQGQCAGGGLADLVVPIAYAPKGSPHAKRLWQYKSIPISRKQVIAGAVPAGSADGAGVAAQAGRLLLALLIVFLREHGRCGWRQAGITWPPTHLAVVPSARGRPGVHPLRTLIAPYLRCHWTELAARPDQHKLRELDPDRFWAAPVPDGRVLLLDDTWTTGASAQSAAMALRRAGARSVATVVLGRHINPEFEPAWPTGPGPPHASRIERQMPFALASCAVHTGDVVG
jgi:hypothetical protein